MNGLQQPHGIGMGTHRFHVDIEQAFLLSAGWFGHFPWVEGPSLPGARFATLWRGSGRALGVRLGPVEMIPLLVLMVRDKNHKLTVLWL